MMFSTIRNRKFLSGTIDYTQEIMRNMNIRGVPELKMFLGCIKPFMYLMLDGKFQQSAYYEEQHLRSIYELIASRSLDFRQKDLHTLPSALFAFTQAKYRTIFSLN